MSALHILNETYTNGYKPIVLDLIALISIICGIFVIIRNNPVESVLFLIGLFLSISCYLIMLGIGFIGLSYLLVYVGAVSILFLFILMLINIRISELLTDSSNSVPLAIIVGIWLNYLIYQLLPYGISVINNSFNNINNYLNIILGDNLFNWFFNDLYKTDNNESIYHISHNLWDSYLIESTHITSIGNVLYTNYSIWLIITSIILLLAMVGAIIITISQKNATKQQDRKSVV